VGVGTILVQRHAEALPSAPSNLDRLLDAILRLSLQAGLARPMCELLGPKGTALLGCAVLALGALAAVSVSGITAQLAAHHMMTSGLHIAEVAAATLIALSANLALDPLPWRVASLVALHLAITVGPGLLPLFRSDGMVGSTGAWLLVSLLPLPLTASVP
jgi:hypothetical protein